MFFRQAAGQLQVCPRSRQEAAHADERLHDEAGDAIPPFLEDPGEIVAVVEAGDQSLLQDLIGNAGRFAARESHSGVVFHAFEEVG